MTQNAVDVVSVMSDANIDFKMQIGIDIFTFSIFSVFFLYSLFTL